jgi:DDE family transposase
VFCGRQLLAAKLRRSNIDASAGAVEEIARIIAQIRHRWPKTRILLRGDSGFAREALMAWCETNRVDFLFGLARNERLEAAIKPELMLAKPGQHSEWQTGTAVQGLYVVNDRQLEPQPPRRRQGRGHRR